MTALNLPRTGVTHAVPPPPGEQLRSDAVIVGAGPAGMLLALLLLRSGFSVTLVERDREFGRAFRGEFLQPGSLRIFEALGVLDDFIARGQVMRDYKICEGTRPVFTYSFDIGTGKRRHGLNISQAVVLPRLLELARTYPGFQFINPATAKALVRNDKGAVCGLLVDRGTDGPLTITATVVAAADGRNSTIRRIAEIGATKLPFQKDVLWFTTRRPAQWPETFTVRLAGGSYVALVPTFPDRLQLGFTLTKGAFHGVRARGMEAFHQQIAAVVPEVTASLAEDLPDWDAISILNVQSLNAERWCEDGLVLLGDAAHTMSPVAGLGITQALKDAVLLHEQLRRPLEAGVLRREDLLTFETTRRAETMRLAKLQQTQERLMLAPGFFGKVLRTVLYPLISASPLMQRMKGTMTLGDLDAEIARVAAVTV